MSAAERRRRLKRTLATATLALAAGCAYQLPRLPTEVIRTGSTVRIQGPITKETARRYAEEVATAPVAQVELDSVGGDVEAALDIAERMVAGGVDVAVSGPCLSSCANYLFPAGRRKTILPGAVVAWHGNARHLQMLHDRGDAPISPEGRPYLDALVQRERRFFDAIGVDESVCWFGKMPPHAVLNSYFLSVDAMARFGIRDVQAPADYKRTDTRAFRTWRGAELVWLEPGD